MNHIISRFRLVLITAFFFQQLGFFAAGSVVSAQEPVKLVLQWAHQSQFAGYYMALEKGYYKQEGLEVSILSGGADVNPLKMLQRGEVDFCLAMLPTVLESYGKEDTRRVMLLSQIVNRSNFALIAWKKGKEGKGRIEKPEDLNAKVITIWKAFDFAYRYFFTQYRVKPQILPQYYTLSLFLHRGADAYSAMLYNEFHTIRQNGIPAEELTVFNFSDLGIDIPEDGIYLTQETWRTRREVSKSFAKASLRGWAYARDHREETLDVVMGYIERGKLPTNRAHMKWMLDVILKSIYPADSSDWIVGKLKKKDFDRTVEIMSLGSEAPLYQDFLAEPACPEEVCDETR